MEHFVSGALGLDIVSRIGQLSELPAHHRDALTTVRRVEVGYASDRCIRPIFAKVGKLAIFGCGAKDLLVPTYTPRFFGRLDTWRISDWAIKVYGIATEAPDRKLILNSELIDEARSFVQANLARMNHTPHYSVGFVILHHGSAAKSLLTQWWTNECVCLQYVAQSEFDGPPKFAHATQDLMACAYELVPIDFERRAWVSTVMSGQSIEAYLDAWLPDGFY